MTRGGSWDQGDASIARPKAVFREDTLLFVSMSVASLAKKKATNWPSWLLGRGSYGQHDAPARVSFWFGSQNGRAFLLYSRTGESWVRPVVFRLFSQVSEPKRKLEAQKKTRLQLPQLHFQLLPARCRGRCWTLGVGALFAPRRGKL